MLPMRIHKETGMRLGWMISRTVCRETGVAFSSAQLQGGAEAGMQM